MDLFIIEGNVVKPSVHALMLHPYSEIWSRDSDPEKSSAIREFTYIEFMCSYKKSNPFKGYPEEIKQEKVLKSVYKDMESDFEEDELIKGGIELYKEFRDKASPTLNYYLAALKGAYKMVKWLRDFNMNRVNTRTGVPLYKPRDITSALKDTFDVMKNLDSLKNKVQEELFESTKTKANKEINHFER